MILLNKKLLLIVILLIPITIISFTNRKTNFYLAEKQSYDINIKINNNTITVPLEEYLIGVVAGEMPASFQLEALKAQAIASRTYAYNYILSSKEILPTTDNQVYLTNEELQNKWQSRYTEYYNKIKKAVEETKGEIITYNDKPIKAYYFSMTNGYTESSLNVFNEENEYLEITKSEWDSDNSYETIMSKEDFCQKLNISCQNIIIGNIIKDESNRISTLTINNQTFTGIELRKKLSLRSTDITIIEENDNIKITTKGYGHGVGMSQYGANNMAKSGYNYQEILKYYYKNTEINNI